MWNLAERICTFFALRMESRRLGKSSSGSPGRKASGREWIANWTWLGARRKGIQGESAIGKEQLSWAVRASKYGGKAAVGVVGLERRRLNEPRSVTLAGTARARVQFPSLRTRAAMSRKVAVIRKDSQCSVGGERGALHLLSAVGRDFSFCRAGADLTTAATFEPVEVFLFVLDPLGALDEAAWVYECWGLCQAGLTSPETKEEGSGYLPSRKALVHESVNLIA